VKYKFAEYCRLHRLLTGVTSKTIWKGLMYKLNPTKYREWVKYHTEDLKGKVPDEFYNWFDGIIKEFDNNVKNTLTEVEEVYEKVKELSRKEQALYLRDFHSNILSLVMLRVDNKDIKETILKRLEPSKDGSFVKET
jgi:RNA ligase